MGWMWGMMGVFWLLFLGGVGGALWWWFRDSRPPRPGPPADDPLAILQIRLARGEITPEEYETVRRLLLRDHPGRGGRPPAGS
ncbi:MAG: SHOCT domain-containing protein [Firmicutes bacterium]|nr:SHOCT domain-containing protein [Bacillota bacterium]